MPEGDLPAPPLGVDFVFDSGQRKLRQQESLIDSLDVKMGVLIGLLGAFFVGLLAAAVTSEASRAGHWLWWPTKIVFYLGILLLGACLFCAYQAFRARQYYLDIPFGSLVEWTNEQPAKTKEAFLALLLEYVEKNEEGLGSKQVWARRATIWVFVTLIVLWASLLLIGVQFLKGRV